MSTKIAQLSASLASSLFAVIASVVWVPPAEAIYIRHDLQSIGSPGIGLDDYDINGLAAGYPTVGYIWKGDASTGQQDCTATVVYGTTSITRIITAAHCVFGADTDPNKSVASSSAKIIDATEAAPFTFSLGTALGNMVGPGLQITGGWYQGNYTGGVSQWDVAVLQLGVGLATLGGAVSPISFADPATWLGNQTTFVGWGVQGAGAFSPNLQVVQNGFNPTDLKYTDPNTQAVYFASDKLAAQNIIDLNPSNFARNLIVTDFDRFDGTGVNPLGNNFGLNFEGTTAAGDSGGPIFPVRIDGLVGVLSGASTTFAAGCRQDSLYDDCSAWAPLSVNKDFVQRALPNPATIWLVGIGLIVMLWALRLPAATMAGCTGAGGAKDL